MTPLTLPLSTHALFAVPVPARSLAFRRSIAAVRARVSAGAVAAVIATQMSRVAFADPVPERGVKYPHAESSPSVSPESGPSAQPPVLLDPAGAQSWAVAQEASPSGRASGSSRALAAEVALLSGDPRLALDLLGPPASDTDSTKIASARIRLDALVALNAPGSSGEVERVAGVLSSDPGWRTHAKRQLEAFRTHPKRSWWGRIGLLLYAAAAGVGVLGGGRALLRFRAAEGLIALSFGGAVALATVAHVRLGELGALAAGASFALVHGLSALASTTQPPRRLRLFLVGLLLLGATGVGLALLDTARIIVSP